MSNDETDSMTKLEAHRYYQPTSIQYASNIDDDRSTTKKPCLWSRVVLWAS